MADKNAKTRRRCGASQPVKEVSPSCKLFGIMEKKRTGGKKNGTVATG